MVKTYNWDLRVSLSEVGRQHYRLKTPNKHIGFIYDQSTNFIFINIRDNVKSQVECAFPVCLPIHEKPYHFQKHQGKITNWLPVIERSTGLPQKAKEDLCKLLERME